MTEDISPAKSFGANFAPNCTATNLALYPHSLSRGITAVLDKFQTGFVGRRSFPGPGTAFIQPLFI